MRWIVLLLPLVLCTGCVERILTVTSNPPRAVVYLNDVEVGRTPPRKEITYYGTYNIVLRLKSDDPANETHVEYETIKDKAVVNPPPWGWPPIDLICEVLPFRFRDTPELKYDLKPVGPVNPNEMIQRSEELKKQLSSEK